MMQFRTTKLLEMNPSSPSTRRVTKDTGHFTRSTQGSRSLERGLLLLREFRLGASSLTNADLARRSGLPRPTVSRLTRSLVDGGFLSYDVEQGAYQLAPVVLSLADAFRFAHQATEVAGPFMREVAQEYRVNVGLAVADQTEMVYLIALRHSPDSTSRLRRVTTGTRIPIHRTATGLAYLAALPPDALRSILDMVLRSAGARAGARAATYHQELMDTVARAKRQGYGTAAYMLGNQAVGRALVGPDRQLYVTNISFEAQAPTSAAEIRQYAKVLKEMNEAIQTAWRA